MLTPTAAPWTVRGASFALWALAAASVVYWGFRLGGGSAANTPAPVARQAPPADPAAIARLLGGAPGGPAAPAGIPPLASRLQLVGVVAGASSGGGAAIIAVDGKPAKHFRVGGVIEEGVVLHSVRGRQAVLATGPGGPELVTLELPPVRGTAVTQAPLPASQAPMPPPPAPAPPPAPQAVVPAAPPQAPFPGAPGTQVAPQPQGSIPAPQSPTLAPAAPAAVPQAPIAAPR
jgi:general secretion pathway protein C